MEPEKKQTDPGWNDPPIFSYSESKDLARSPKRNLLNKRVAYPLTGTDGSKIEASTMPSPIFNSGCPPPAVAAPPPILSKNTTEIKDSCCDTEKCVDSRTYSAGSESLGNLEEVLANVNHVIEDKRQLLQNQNKYEQIKKKIHIMEEAWKNKLTNEIREKITRLAAAMKEQRKSEANEIQASLMVDYPKLCSEFISAFRMLINLE